MKITEDGGRTDAYLLLSTPFWEFHGTGRDDIGRVVVKDVFAFYSLLGVSGSCLELGAGAGLGAFLLPFGSF